MFGLPKEIVIFDLECTTWDGAITRNWSGPGEHREVVQAGAVLVETEGFTELDSITFLVKPQVNPTLSEYFVALTNIAQEEVDAKGVNFSVFLERFVAWSEGFDLYCFDRVNQTPPRLLDRDILVENCGLLGIEFPFPKDRFHNVNEIFHQHGYYVEQSGSAPAAFGLDIPHRIHDALNDVRGIIIGLKTLTGRI